METTACLCDPTTHADGLLDMGGEDKKKKPAHRKPRVLDEVSNLCGGHCGSAAII